MNRRDTIIIAVLLNAGLLIVLFATSLKSETTPSDAVPVIAQVEQPAPTIVSAPMTAADMQPLPSASSMANGVQVSSIADEVEQAARQYTPPAVATESTTNFAAEIAAINPPTPAFEPKPEPSYKEVKVKKGDALEKIARHHHVSVDELMKANQLTSTRLKIGQTLKIPSKQTEVAAAAPSEITDAAVKYYTVKPGDNPWTIAVKNHMKVEDLLKLNNMNEQQAKRLKVGDKLRIQ
ncbi:MAG: LysM peptidoglycan-binding domain-containing protein [Verrucomicrobia bacterium]|nr:LysM peptidoglycan-binding domain-containing protein [Verrucomicrobiota bacterium]